ncbi:MAPEG family protein [Sulfitobacter aestuarii]|uniref:MAPEG family protein n=1 Tax=Sulfitobacter aestuarii TaxID=2161676 RepID=A0ABW5U4X3_9RHOB
MTEAHILALYGFLVLLTLLLQVTGSMQQLSLGYLMSNRDEHRSVTGWTARLKRALDNSVVAMALFAPAILLLIATKQTSDASLLAAQVFLIGRIVYLPAYVFGLVGLRTLSWLVGFAATTVLYFLAL